LGQSSNWMFPELGLDGKPNARSMNYQQKGNYAQPG
jgi:hypothetical protein